MRLPSKQCELEWWYFCGVNKHVRSSQSIYTVVNSIHCLTSIDELVKKNYFCFIYIAFCTLFNPKYIAKVIEVYRFFYILKQRWNEMNKKNLLLYSENCVSFRYKAVGKIIIEATVILVYITYIIIMNTAADNANDRNFLSNSIRSTVRNLTCFKMHHFHVGHSAYSIRQWIDMHARMYLKCTHASNLHPYTKIY